MANFNQVYNFIAKDKFSGAVTKITNKNTRFNRSLKKSNVRLRKLTRNFKKSAQSSKLLKSGVGKLIAVLGGFVGLQKASEMFRVFEDNLLELSAITGATGKDLDFLKDSAFELGTAFSRSGAETLEAFKLVASAKPELLQNLPVLKAMTEQVLILAAASGIELSEAAEATAQALNIFGQGADQASRFVNVLAAGSKFGTSVVQDTAAALRKAGPAAAAAGLSFEQLNGVIQIMARGGIKAEQAGTALSTVLIRLQREGIDFSKIGIGQAFIDIRKEIENLTTVKEKSARMEELFGLENIKSMHGVLRNAEAIDKMTRSLTATNVAIEQANIRLQSLNKLWDKLGTTMEQKIVRVMDGPLGASMIIMIGLLDEMTARFTKDELLGFSALLTVIAFSLGAVGLAVFAVIKLFAVLLSTLVKIGKVMAALAAWTMTGGGFDLGFALSQIVGEEEERALIEAHRLKEAMGKQKNKNGGPDFKSAAISFLQNTPENKTPTSVVAVSKLEGMIKILVETPAGTVAKVSADTNVPIFDTGQNTVGLA